MHLMLVLYVFAGLVGLRLCIWAVQQLSAPDRALPGPWVARFTKLWYLHQVRTGTFHHTNITLHEKYGPIVRVAPGWYSISDPDKSVYGIGSKFAKSDWYDGWKHPSSSRWTVFTLRDIKKHGEERRKFQALYSLSALLSYESYVDHCVDIFKQRMSEFTSSGQTIELAHWLQCYAFDVIGEITYSQRFGFLDAGEDMGGAIHALDKNMPYSTLVGIYPKLHPYLYAIMEKFAGSGAAGRTYLMNYTRGRIDERMEARKKTNYKARAESKAEEESTVPRDFLDKIADANERDPEKVSPYHIFAMGMSNIIAGSDTTAVSLSGAMYYLTTTPRVLTKLREEIAPRRHEGRNLTFKETQDMPYLQAVIKEALRLHPATGLPLWRVVPEGGAEVAGQWFPAGTNIGTNSWVAHYNPSVWGDDVREFRPERWLESDEQQLQRMEAHYLPFGLGSRTCQGRHISFLEMSKLIPEVVANFDMALMIPKEQWKTVNYWFVKPESFPVQVKMVKRA